MHIHKMEDIRRKRKKGYEEDVPQDEDVPKNRWYHIQKQMKYDITSKLIFNYIFNKLCKLHPRRNQERSNKRIIDQEIRQMSHKIDCILFKDAKTYPEYCNLDTLESRIIKYIKLCNTNNTAAIKESTIMVESSTSSTIKCIPIEHNNPLNEWDNLLFELSKIY